MNNMGKYEIGMIFKNNQGEEFEIIEVMDKKFRKIKFLNFDYEKVVSISNINYGKVKCNINEKYAVGKVFTTNEGYNIEITEYVDRTHRRIKFLDLYGTEIIVKYSSIKTGSIKNPFHKSCKNIGYFGIGEYSYKEYGIEYCSYKAWVGIIDRSFCKNLKTKHPTYINVTMCKEWECFQVFTKWYIENYPSHISDIKFQLDKDLLQQGIENKIYSPETCVFLPSKINLFMTNIRKNNTTGFTGVSYEKDTNKYRAIINDFETGKAIHLGRFSTPEEASQAYQTARAINAEKAKQYLRDLNYLPEHIIQLIK